jgi:Ca2+-binding RTX toxin-like protein
VTGGSGAANTTVTLGTGTDTVNLSAGSGTNTIDATASTLLAADILTGGSGTDTLALTGGGTFDLSGLSTFSSMNVVTLDGSGGTVVLRLGTTLTVNGVSGASNILDLSHGTGAVTINLGSASFNAGGGFNTTTFSNIDGVTGTNFADTITANNSGDRITGGGGADLIKLGSGADTLVYKATSDSTPASFQTIGVNGNPASTDFTPGTDKIDLTAISAAPLTFQAAQLGGTIAAHTIGWVQSGNGANTVSDVYVNISGSTENLAAADMEIHLLGQKGLTLTAADFIHN